MNVLRFADPLQGKVLVGGDSGFVMAECQDPEKVSILPRFITPFIYTVVMTKPGMCSKAQSASEWAMKKSSCAPVAADGAARNPAYVLKSGKGQDKVSADHDFENSPVDSGDSSDYGTHTGHHAGFVREV